jgi:error-prone DNA polymerase
MSRKRSRENMARFLEMFVEGAAARGVDPGVAATVFEKIVAFAEFGFPKSHAAAFAFLAYQSAWLRRYYPVEFLCALLNAQPMGFYPPHVLTHDARRHDVNVLPPDVNESDARCSVQDGYLRVGFGYVKAIGADVALAIACERAERGAFTSLADFVRRLGVARDGASLPSQEAIENLVQVGAFDRFGMNRRELLWQLGLLYRPPATQLALPMPVEQDAARLRDMDTWERMSADYNLLSLSPTYHPMALMRPSLNESLPSIRHLLHLPDGQKVRVPGMVVCRQQPGTAKGFVFLLVEDEFGMVNVIVPPWLHEQQRALVRGEPFVIIDGELQRKEGTVNLLARSFSALPIPRSLRAPESHNFG